MYFNDLLKNARNVVNYVCGLQIVNARNLQHLHPGLLKNPRERRGNTEPWGAPKLNGCNQGRNLSKELGEVK